MFRTFITGFPVALFAATATLAGCAGGAEPEPESLGRTSSAITATSECSAAWSGSSVWLDCATQQQLLKLERRLPDGSWTGVAVGAILYRETPWTVVDTPPERTPVYRLYEVTYVPHGPAVTSYYLPGGAVALDDSTFTVAARHDGRSLGPAGCSFTPGCGHALLTCTSYGRDDFSIAQFQPTLNGWTSDGAVVFQAGGGSLTADLPNLRTMLGQNGQEIFPPGASPFDAQSFAIPESCPPPPEPPPPPYCGGGRHWCGPDTGCVPKGQLCW